MTNQQPSRREFLKYAAGVAGALAVQYISPLEALAKGNKPERKKSHKKEATPFQQKIKKMRVANYADFGNDPDEVLLAKMLFGEARSCSDLEKVAVAYTPLNRAEDGVAWNGRTLKEAILEPFQYECFNLGNANRDKLKAPNKYDSKSFDQCLKVARDVLSGRYQDPTNGATTYYNPTTIKEPERFKKMQKIGRINTSQGPSKHVFYKEK